MPEKPRLPRAQVYHTGDDDHEQIERAREVVKFARKVLAESDPSFCFAGARAKHPPMANS